MPHVWQLLQDNVGIGDEVLWLRHSVRYGSAFRVLTLLYALVYDSFAGGVATLVFLYIRAATLIFGAEINAVLREKAAPPVAPRTQPIEPG